MEVLFEVPMSYTSPHACQRLLKCLETQRFLYEIVRGIRDKEYREINILVTYPARFNISVSKVDASGEGILSRLSVFDLKDEFMESGKTFPLAHDVAVHHIRGLLWRYLSWDKTLPWNFVKEEKKGFLFLAKKETVVGDFYRAKKKWEQFLGEEVR